MKRFVGIIIISINLIASIFAENVTLKVFKTDYGIEVNNIDNNGKVICNKKVILIVQNIEIRLSYLYYIVRENSKISSINSIDAIKQEIFNGNFSYKENRFINNNEVVINNENILDKGSKSFILLPIDREIKKCRAYGRDGNMYIYINYIDDKTTPTSEELTKKYYESIENKRANSEIQKKEIQERFNKQFIANENEGYDSIPWGANLEEVQTLIPEGKVGYIDNIAILHVKHTSSSKPNKQYFFYNNKLYAGLTMYGNLDDNWSMNSDNTRTIIQKIYKSFGTPDNKNDSEEIIHKSGMLQQFNNYKEIQSILQWNKSTTFQIGCIMIERDYAESETDLYLGNYYGAGYSIQIMYNNPEISIKVKTEQDKKRLEEEERKMNDFDL